MDNIERNITYGKSAWVSTSFTTYILVKSYRFLFQISLGRAVVIGRRYSSIWFINIQNNARGFTQHIVQGINNK